MVLIRTYEANYTACGICEPTDRIPGRPPTDEQTADGLPTVDRQDRPGTFPKLQTIAETWETRGNLEFFDF